MVNWENTKSIVSLYTMYPKSIVQVSSLGSKEFFGIILNSMLDPKT
jgi:hypothetical protein